MFNAGWIRLDVVRYNGSPLRTNQDRSSIRCYGRKWRSTILVTTRLVLHALVAMTESPDVQVMMLLCLPWSSQ